MTQLIRYEAACRAIADAKSVDEVKDIANKATAMKLYARQAKNKQLEVDAAEIRLRAERHIGELMEAQRGAGLMAPAGRKADKIGSDENPISKNPSLAEIGIDKSLANRARKLAAVPCEKFEQHIGVWRDRVSQEGERVSIALIAEGTKAERRARREAELADKQRALPDKKYGVIYADPEWRFETYSRETGMDRAADNHYPTSNLDAICARDVGSIAADDCVLFLWVTGPMLASGAFLRVLEAWGFKGKSCITWAKDKIGTGYWARDKAEYLIIATRGNVPCPAMGDQCDSLIEAPVGPHSAKPERFAEIIEAYFPNLPKIELNRRGPPRRGWDAWGNEAGGA